MNLLFDITLVAVAVALSCAIVGVFLVLRGSTMVSDAITHTVLLGIVLGYFVAGDLDSPILMIGATLVGVLTVWMIEALRNTGLVEHDAATGIIFPFLFSVALILMTRYASDVHLDIDSVFMGEIGFTVFNRYSINGIDLGPKAFINALVIFLINSAFVAIFYKELQVSTFDPKYAASIGISTTAVYYALMTLVSLTAVGAFDAVGSILVVGLMVGPGVTGYMLCNRLSSTIIVALISAVISAVTGVFVAYQLDLSYAGIIAVVTGIIALLAILFSPKKGVFKTIINRRKRQAKLADH